MKHTPAKWSVAQTGNHQGLIVEENTGKNIAVAYDKKNAVLLSIAPELYEAMLAIWARVVGEFDHPALVAYGPLSETISEDVLAIAEAALTKVEGGKP